MSLVLFTYTTSRREESPSQLPWRTDRWEEEGAKEGEMDIQCRGWIMRAGHHSLVVRVLANLRATGPSGFHEPAHSPPVGLITHVFSWEWEREMTSVVDL